MNLAQFEDDFGYDDPGYYDLLAEPTPQLVEYQETVPTAGATPSILDQIVSFGQKLVPVVLSYQQKKELNDINVERAKRGQPPLDMNAYLRSSAPQIRAGLTTDTQKMLMYGGLLIAGVFIFSAVMRRR